MHTAKCSMSITKMQTTKQHLIDISQRWNNGYINNIHANNIPFDGEGLSTGTLGSNGTMIESDKIIYVEKLINLPTSNRTQVRFVLDGGNGACYVPIRKSNGIYFLYCARSVLVAGYHYLYMVVFDSSGAVTDDTISGTFKFKYLN